MGILHVQSLLLQKLAREENGAKGLSRASFESSPIEERNVELAIRSNSQDLLRDVGSAVATLWMERRKTGSWTYNETGIAR